MQLAQDLEWLGCELEHYGYEHAMRGFPQSGPLWDTFCEKQRGVLVTADKIERELKGAVRYNPSGLAGMEFPVEEALDSIAALLAEVEEIKHCSVYAVQLIPSRVRAFTKMIEEYLQARGKVSDSPRGSGERPCALAVGGRRVASRAFRESSRRLRIMDEQQLTKQLQDEGFGDVYVWEDGPDMTYPTHQHPDVSAHIILAGEMTVTVDGHTRTYKPGERFDIPGKTPHSARMGPEGCRYLVGEM